MNEKQLQEDLAALSAWPAETPGLWRRALERGRPGILRRRWFELAIAAAIVVVAGAGLVVPNLGRFGAAPVPAALVVDPATRGQNLRTLGTAHAAYSTAPSAGGGASGGLSDVSASLMGGAKLTQGMERHVARRATLQLVTDDVRAAFVQTMHVALDARGEFVESSSLAGAGTSAQAEVTLRVESTRLDAVLNELRAFGDVQSEQLAGDDVTAQVVDIEARLRNEQRIEQELLDLLEKRPDAPLEEIMQLRTHLGGVRSTIEQLTAQRDHLGRLVDLARVLVIIRAADGARSAAGNSDESGIGDHFVAAIAGAWSSGVRFLVDTLATLLRVLVGGAVWWVLLIALVVVLQRHRQQHRVPAQT